MTRWSAFGQPPNSYTTSWDSTGRFLQSLFARAGAGPGHCSATGDGSSWGRPPAGDTIPGSVRCQGRQGGLIMPLAPAEAVGNVPDTQPVARHAGDGGRDAHPGHRPPDGVPIRHVAAVAVLRFHPLGKAEDIALAGGNRASRHLTPRSTATTAPFGGLWLKIAVKTAACARPFAAR